MTYKFVQFDPRPQGADANENIFRTSCEICLHSSGQLEGRDCHYCGGTGVSPVFGIEVTIPVLAKRCVANLDHHGVGDTAETPSACEQALNPKVDFPPYGAVLVTVRPDADSVTAMAILVNRSGVLTIDADSVWTYSKDAGSKGWEPVRINFTSKEESHKKIQILFGCDAERFISLCPHEDELVLDKSVWVEEVVLSQAKFDLPRLNSVRVQVDYESSYQIFYLSVAGELLRKSNKLSRRSTSSSIDAGMPGNEDGAWGSSSSDGWRVD